MTIVEVMVAFSIILICIATVMGVIQLASKTLYVSGEFDNQTTEISEKTFAEKDYYYDAESDKMYITPKAISGGAIENQGITFQEEGNVTSTFTISCSRVQTTDSQGQTYYIYKK